MKKNKEVWQYYQDIINKCEANRSAILNSYGKFLKVYLIVITVIFIGRIISI